MSLLSRRRRDVERAPVPGQPSKVAQLLMTRTEIGYDLAFWFEAVDAVLYRAAEVASGAEAGSLYADGIWTGRMPLHEVIRFVAHSGYVTPDEVEEWRGALRVRCAYLGREYPRTQDMRAASSTLRRLDATWRDRLGPLAPPVVQKPEPLPPL